MILGYLGAEPSPAAVQMAAAKLDSGTAEFARDVANGRVYSSILQLKSDLQDSYRGLRDGRMKMMAMKDSGQKNKALSVYNAGRDALGRAKNDVNTAIEKHDELIGQLRQKSYTFLGSRPDLKAISAKVYEPAGLEGLSCAPCMMAAGLMGLGAVPAVIPAVVAFASSSPISFAVTAAVATVIVGIIAFFFLTLLYALMRWIGNALTGTAQGKSIIEEFSDLVGAATNLVQTAAISILVIGGAFVGYLFLKKKGKI